jgi:hypothetical protein
MKRQMGAFLLLITTLASAQELPTKNPSEVYVKGRKVSHSWRGGRIWVPTSDLQPLLNISSELPSMDLLKALEEKGGYIWSVSGARFDAKPDPSLYSTTTRTNSPSRVNGSQGYGDTAGAGQDRAVISGKLSYGVKSFTADTGYVRAFVTVTNEGPGVSDPSEMLCQFQDGFGRIYSADRQAVPPLDSGESREYECFSMVESRDTSMTMTRDNVAVNFFSLTNPSANPTSQKEMRKQAKAGKKGKNGSTLDFNAGYGDFNKSR